MSYESEEARAYEDPEPVDVEQVAQEEAAMGEPEAAEPVDVEQVAQEEAAAGEPEAAEPSPAYATSGSTQPPEAEQTEQGEEDNGEDTAMNNGNGGGDSPEELLKRLKGDLRTQQQESQAAQQDAELKKQQQAAIDKDLQTLEKARQDGEKALQEYEGARQDLEARFSDLEDDYQQKMAWIEDKVDKTAIKGKIKAVDDDIRKEQASVDGLELTCDLELRECEDEKPKPVDTDNGSAKYADCEDDNAQEGEDEEQEAAGPDNGSVQYARVAHDNAQGGPAGLTKRQQEYDALKNTKKAAEAWLKEAESLRKDIESEEEADQLDRMYVLLYDLCKLLAQKAKMLPPVDDLRAALDGGWTALFAAHEQLRNAKLLYDARQADLAIARNQLDQAREQRRDWIYQKLPV